MGRMSQRTKLVLLLLIVAGGFGLRYVCLEWGQGYRFSAIGDEIEAYRFALDYRQGQPPAQYLGQPNFRGGKVPGPLWALFWLAGLKLTNSPDGVMLLITLLNTAVIPLVYLLAQRLVGGSAPLWAALFYATAPWPVHFSLGATNPLMMAFLGALLYLALWHVITHKQSPHIVWVCAILAVMPQFHMVAVFLLPAVILVLILAAPRIHRGWLTAGLLIGAAMYYPYLLGEVRHHWSNSCNILRGDGRVSSVGVLKALTEPFTILSNLISSWPGRNLAEYKAFGDAIFGSFAVLAFFNLVSLCLSIFSVVAIVTTVFRALRDQSFSFRAAFQKSPPELFVATLLAVPLFLFLFTSHDFTSRYLVVLTPLLFLLPARLILSPTSPDAWRKPLFAMAVITIAFNVILTPLFYFNQGRRIDAGDTFIPSFRKMESVRRALERDAGTHCRIQLDVSAFPPQSIEDTAFGVRTLDKYLRLFEGRTPDTSSEQPVKAYQVLPAASATATHSQPAFAGNGIVIVAKD